MRTKKNVSNRKRKYRNKKSNKSKKCGCGVKLPFFKWGGDSPNGQTQPQPTDLSGKVKNFFSATNDKLTGDFNNLTSASKKAIENVTKSTTSVINDTNKHISENTQNVINKTQSDAKNTSGKISDFFNGIIANAKNTLHNVTKPNSASNKDGATITKPVSASNTSTGSTSSLSNSSGSTSSITNSSNSNANKYNGNAIKRYQNSLNNNNNNKQGGKRKSSKKRYVKSMKSKKTKKTKRRQMYKHKGGSTCMNGTVGIENSSLAFTASPISNIKSVGPSADQMYGQTPYPAWRFSN